MNYKQRLKEYIEENQIYQDYKKGKEPAHNDGNTECEWFCIQHCKNIEDLLNEVEVLEWDNNDKKGIEYDYLTLLEKYNRRETKWKKWETEKSIISNRMSEYLCKYQNIKREYTNQIANATKKKKKIEELHNKIDKAIEYLINPPKKIWEEHSINEVVRILKDSDVDE